jgi:hypothetical protein
MKHKPHIFANPQHCWQHYITFPNIIKSSQFQINSLNTKKVLVVHLSCYSSSDIRMKKFWNPCFKAFCSVKIVLLAAILNLGKIKTNLPHDKTTTELAGQGYAV